MKIRRIILKFFVFLLIAVLMDQFLGFCLEKLADRVSFDFRARVRMKEFYRYETNTDILFLGSSRTYMEFNPYIFDNALNIDSFNLGSAGQSPIVTYYVLKEALRIGQRPRLVVMETYYRVLKKHEKDYDYAAYVFRSMRSSKNKLALLRAAFKFPSALKLLSRFFNDRYLIELCVKYLSGADTGHYLGKGYVEYTSTVSQSVLLDIELDFRDIKLDSRRLRYLERIVELAIAERIHIIFVSAPLPPTVIRNSQGYRDLYNIIKTIADKYGIEYIDYNVLNDDLQIFTDENFKDSQHMNKSGVEVFNNHLIQWLTDTYGPDLQFPEVD